MSNKITVVLVALTFWVSPCLASASDGNLNAPIPSFEERAPLKMELARDWIMGFITAQAPPGRAVYYPDSQETAEEALTRYSSIAEDIVQVAYDPARTPLFQGKDGRSRTVAFIAAIMLHESSFFKHVDYGLGKYARGDNGKAWCLMQVQPFKGGKTMSWNTVQDRAIRYNDPPEEISEGFTGEEMVQERQKCIVAGLRVLRVSLASCRKLPLTEQLASYTSGSCDRGRSASKDRVTTALRWFDQSVKAREGFTDLEVVQGVAALRAFGQDEPEFPVGLFSRS